MLAKRLLKAGAEKVDRTIKFDTAAGTGTASYTLWVTVVIRDVPFKPVYVRTCFAVAKAGENIILSYRWLKENGLVNLAVPTEDRNHIQTETEGIQFLAEEMEYSMKRKPLEEVKYNDPDKISEIKTVLAKYGPLLNGREENHCARVEPMKLELIDKEQIKKLPYVKAHRLSPMQLSIVRKQIDDLVAKGYIQKSDSQVSSLN